MGLNTSLGAQDIAISLFESWFPPFDSNGNRFDLGVSDTMVDGSIRFEGGKSGDLLLIPGIIFSKIYSKDGAFAFINTTAQSIETLKSGDIYLNNCTAEYVSSAGNLYLINCPNIKKVKAIGSIFVENCPNLKIINNLQDLNNESSATNPSIFVKGRII